MIIHSAGDQPLAPESLIVNIILKTINSIFLLDKFVTFHFKLFRMICKTIQSYIIINYVSLCHFLIYHGNTMRMT